MFWQEEDLARIQPQGLHVHTGLVLMQPGQQGSERDPVPASKQTCSFLWLRAKNIWLTSQKLCLPTRPHGKAGHTEARKTHG